MTKLLLAQILSLKKNINIIKNLFFIKVFTNHEIIIYFSQLKNSLNFVVFCILFPEGAIFRYFSHIFADQLEILLLDSLLNIV